MRLFLAIALATLPLQIVTSQGSDKKTRPEKLLMEIQAILDSVKKNEVFSPAITKENLRSIIAKEKEANKTISTLSPGEKSELQNKQKQISQTYQSAIKSMVETSITADFKSYGSTILKETAPIATTALAGAGTGVFLQIAQAGISSLASTGINSLSSIRIDTNSLKARATENALIAIIQRGSEPLIGNTYATFASGTGARALTAAISTGQLPTPMGIITAGIVNEAFTVVMEVVDSYGGVAGIAEKINWGGLVVREKNTLAITTVTNEVLPQMANLVKNQSVHSIIMEVGGKTLQAGVIGGLFRLSLAGIGLIPAEDVAASISAGVMEGAITGLMAAIGSTVTGKEGGVITTSSQVLTTIGRAIYKGAPTIPLTQQSILQGIGHAAVQTIIPALTSRDLVANITQSTASVLKNHWMPTWNSLSNIVSNIRGTISEFVETVQSIEPLPI